MGAHARRATAADNALDHQADIAKVQEWLGHANIETMQIYDRRKTRPKTSPTLKVAYWARLRYSEGEMALNSGIILLLGCGMLFLVVALIDAVQRRSSRIFGVSFIIWLAVTALALYYLQATTGRVTFGSNSSYLLTFGVILLGTSLGIAARYLFYLKHPSDFSWFRLLKPLCITPIVVLPLVGSMQRNGEIEPFQIVMFCLLAFQNGFFWQAVLDRAEVRVRET